MDVTPHTSVEEFFREAVLDALDDAQVEATEATESYLVHLLGGYAATRITDEPLSLKLAQSQVNPAERVKALKEVGDTSLYISGFFRASLDRQLVDAGFYMGLGSSAYRELSQRLAGNSAVGAIYGELASKFAAFADVLNQISNQLDLASGNIVKLYEQWLSTRSEAVERRLRGLGVLLSSPSNGSGYLQ